MEWYDKLSVGYEELYGREQAPKYQLAMDSVSGKEFDLAVDVACGTGMFLDKLRGKCNYAVGVDLSRRMLEKAKSRLGVKDVGLIRADSSNLPLREKVADCLFAISLVEAKIKSREQVSEMARALKTCGFLVVTVFHSDGEKVDLGGLEVEGVEYHAGLSSIEDLFLIRGDAVG